MKDLTHKEARFYLHLGDTDLSGAERQALAQHLVECQICHRYSSELAILQVQLTRVMRSHWNQFTPNPHLSQLVQQRLQRQTVQRTTLKFISASSSAIVLIMLVLIVGWLVWQTNQATPTPASLTIALDTPSPGTPQPLQLSGDWPELPGLATFGARFKLLGYIIDNTLAPNSQAQVALYWQTSETNITAYTIFMHLYDANEQLVAQADLPVGGDACARLSQFSPGMFGACYAIPINIPPGQYQLRVGFYKPTTGERLLTDKGESAALLTTLNIGVPPVGTEEADVSEAVAILTTPDNASAPIATEEVQFTCPVTPPNGSIPPGEQPSALYHGDGKLWTTLWPEGQIIFEPGGPGEIAADGSLSMKWPWWRGVAGQLTITGRRLDAPESPLRHSIPNGYGESGFQATALIFPSAGCWEITGKVGEAELTFVQTVTELP